MMEEEGTEILFRPGTETKLAKHFSSKRKGKRKNELNLLQYCTIDEGAEKDVNQELLATHTLSEESSSKSSSSPSEEEQRQEESTESVFFPDSTTKETPSSPTLNRHDSLMENDSVDEDDESICSEQRDSNNENEKAAVFNEGQEAVWHEDEYSTVSSVHVVKPDKPKKKKKVPFFKLRMKKVQKEQPSAEEVESTCRPVKIHVKENKVAKAVLLQPPEEAEVKATEETNNQENINDNSERLLKENEQDTSITKNSNQARQLLHAALSGDDLDEEKSKQAVQEVFDCKNNEIENNTSDDDNSNEEAIELEYVMSYLAEEGRDEEESNPEGARYANAIDLTMIEADESDKARKKIHSKFPVSRYASRAVHYLESILPKNNGNETDGHNMAAVLDDASNAKDFWSDADVSTLGLKNDTQEYGLDQDENLDDDNHLDHDGAGLLRNSDMASIASLNEILDGEETVDVEETSPRAAVQEIEIPEKKQNLTSPREQMDDNIDNNGNNKWNIFFRTPRATDAVPSQVNLVLESPGDHSEVQNPGETSSPASSPTSTGENVESEVEDPIETGSELCDDMPQSTRYAPAFAEEDKGSETSECDQKVQNNLIAVDADEKSNDDQGSRDRYHTEPIGVTPRRNGLEMEVNVNRKSNMEEINAPEDSIHPSSSGEDPAQITETEGDEKSTSAEGTTIENEKPIDKKIAAADEGLACDPPNRDETADEGLPCAPPNRDEKDVKDEMSSGQCAAGSKSKRLARVKDRIAKNKRKPLIPNAVVEEKYFVDKDMKKISSGEHHIHKSNKSSKTKTCPSSEKKKSVNSSFTYVPDSATVIQKAITKGNLKAVESNEEGDDVVPLNYLSAMLRKKLREEKVKNFNDDYGTIDVKMSSRDKVDTNSFVAAIRGPRHKEAPGVALEEAAIRNRHNDRDPNTGNDMNKVLIDLAPTPRRPEGKNSTFEDDEKEANMNREMPMKEEEDERQRRKLITERLFQAGRPSSSKETEIKKEVSRDIKTAPTVASAESYCEDPAEQSNIDPGNESGTNDEVMQKHTRFKSGRRMLSIAFLKGNKRK